MFDSGIRLAKVVRVYPDGHSVDLVMHDDNSPCSNVQVLSGTASSRSGFSGLVEPTAPPDGEWGNQDSGDEDMTAVVAYMKGHPVVMGFLYPQVSQMLFGDKNRMTFRSPSDVYATVDGAGNFELAFPGGAYIRVGGTPEHEDLTGKDYDRKWQINRNTGAKVHIHIEQADGLASVDIAPTGAITIKTKSTIDVEADDSISIHTKSTLNVQADAPATVKAPTVTIDSPTTTCTGDLNVAGTLGVSGGINAGGDIHSAGSIIDTAGNTNHHSH